MIQFQEQLKIDRINVLCAPSQHGKSTFIKTWIQKTHKDTDVDPILYFSLASAPIDWKYKGSCLSYFVNQIILQLSEFTKESPSSIINRHPVLGLMLSNKEQALLTIPDHFPIEEFIPLIAQILSGVSKPWTLIFDDGYLALTKISEFNLMSFVAMLHEQSFVRQIIISTSHEYTVKTVLKKECDRLINWIELPKFTLRKWQKKIFKEFSQWKKSKETNEQLEVLYNYLQGHPVYLNEFILYAKANANTARGVLLPMQWLDQALEYRRPLLKVIEESLTLSQKNYLIALARAEKKLYSKTILDHYGLGTSANVARMKKTLLDREILVELNAQLYFTDPIMHLHFKSLSNPKALNRSES